MGASIDELAANRCGVRGWGSSFIDRGNFVHSEGFAPLNQCPVARIPDIFALSMFKEFHILEAVHGYGLLRQTQWQFPASGSVHEKGFTLPETIFIGTVFCQGFTPSLLSVCPHPWVQYIVPLHHFLVLLTVAAFRSVRFGHPIMRQGRFGFLGIALLHQKSLHGELLLQEG